MQRWWPPSTRTCGSFEASEARRGRVASSVISFRARGELEEELLEVEALGGHLVDSGACSGGCESDRLGCGLERHDNLRSDDFCTDALRGQSGAQPFGVRRADTDRCPAAPR